MFNHSSLKRCATAGVAVAAAALPAAAHGDIVAVASTAAGSAPAVTSPAVSASHHAGADMGFVWGDAGIGAGGAVVLIAGCAGAASAMRRRWTVRSA
jgi:hypothetical protein